MTIIRGGLSLPRPTAMNMPMPISVACSGPMTSIHRSCFSAMARASSARTAGLTSFEARFDSVRAISEPSAMIRPRSAAFVERGRVGAGRDQDELVEVRQGQVDLVAVDGPRVVRALGDAARDQLGAAAAASPPSASMSGSSQTASRWTVRPPRRRTRGRPDPDDDLAVDRVAGRRDRRSAAGRPWPRRPPRCAPA